MPDPISRRRDIRLTLAGALLGAIGAGLVPSFLVGYLALDLGASGLAVAWLVAAPRFAGVQRLAAPALLAGAARRGYSRKGLCLAGYLISAAVLAGVPLITLGVPVETKAAENAGRITLLVVAWLVHKMTRQLADVFYWSWIGDLYPARRHSRLVGLRERFKTLGSVVGIGTSVALAVGWFWATNDGQTLREGVRGWATGDVRTPLAVSAWAGVVMMLAAVAPLGLVRSLAARPSATPESPWQTLRAALAERPYRRLLAYQAWLAFANGITGAANYKYPTTALGLSYPLVQSAKVGMWLGQSVLAGWSGRLLARFGARSVMIPAQVLVAFGPPAYLLVTPEAWQWIFLPYALWIAYAALNVGLNSLQIGLANPENNSPYLAVSQTISGLLNGVTVVLGGWLYDELTERESNLDGFITLFVVGCVARLVAVWPLARLIEPRRG